MPAATATAAEVASIAKLAAASPPAPVFGTPTVELAVSVVPVVCIMSSVLVEPVVCAPAILATPKIDATASDVMIFFIDYLN